MYLAAEAALHALVLQEGTFTGEICRRDDWRALDAPSPYGLYAVVEQAGDTLEDDRIGGYGGHGRRTQQHDISVAVLAAIGSAAGGDDTAVRLCKETAERLADWIAGYERLDNAATVQRARVVRITAPRGVARTQASGGAASHIQQQIVVRVITQEAAAPREAAH